MASGTKLVMGALLVAGVTGYMAYLGAATSWQYYVTVDECLANGPSLIGKPIRVSGTVAPGSLRVEPDRSRAEFALQGTNARLQVRARSPLPDHLDENREVVVEGSLDEDGLIRARRILTRCASKYGSQESAAQAPGLPSRHQSEEG